MNPRNSKKREKEFEVQITPLIIIKTKKNQIERDVKYQQ